jgi:predicted extracellular nuclease
MKTIRIILIFFLFFSTYAMAQKTTDKDFTVAFYNVENLFDTIDDPEIRDDEFTPSSEKNWNTERYNKKLEDLSKVLSSFSKDKNPEIIGLAEIENKDVLKDLANTKLLGDSPYSYVHYNSPDTRGIDVALLYREKQFEVISSSSIPIVFPFDRETRVRDILYVKGIAGADTMHIYVNHWKSRYGGREATEKKRVYSARVLKNHTDSVLDENPSAKIIAIGDFNDEPLNKSLKDVLGAKSPEKVSDDYKLYNLLMEKDRKGKGTYNYQYEWFMLDNFIVSSSFLQAKEGYTIHPDSIHIYRADWVLYDNPKAGMKVPNRTYGGPNYFGGISDHLAIYGVFQLKEENKK